jgi:DNA-binding FrmR family transcriptional regulator
MSYRPKDTKERILHRLKIARGHLNKVIAMVEENTYCIDIIHQSKAVQKALKEVDILTLENHLNGCVTESIKNGKKDEAIAEVMNIFKKS